MPTVPPGSEQMIAQAAGNPLNQAFNIWSQGVLNKTQQKWAIAMYERQRKDSLADWNMMNEYNTPMSQMSRLRQAGLNPMLMAGTPNVGNADVPRKAEQGSMPALQLPQKFGMGSPMEYADLNMRTAQVDQVRAQTAALENEAKLKAVLTANALKTGSKSDIDLKYYDDFKVAMYGKLMQEIQSTKYKTDLDLQEYSRRDKANPIALQQQKESLDLFRQMKEPTVKKAWALIVKMKQDAATSKAQQSYIGEMANNVNVQRELNQIELEMRRKGGSFKDPQWQRQLLNLWDEIFQ